MLQPKRTKFRKQMKGKNRGVAWRGSDVSFGDFALQATEASRISARQIEAGRMAIMRSVKRQGKLFIRIFPDKPVTKKPLEVRMGSGKGSVELWVAPVKPGRVLFEIAGVTEEQAREAFKLAATKLPVATRFLARGAFE
jgi:large subunit ribosomal protein L16